MSVTSCSILFSEFSVSFIAERIPETVSDVIEEFTLRFKTAFFCSTDRDDKSPFLPRAARSCFPASVSLIKFGSEIKSASSEELNLEYVSSRFRLAPVPQLVVKKSQPARIKMMKVENKNNSFFIHSLQNILYKTQQNQFLLY